MAAGKLGDEKQELPEHKLVNIKNRGGYGKLLTFMISKNLLNNKQNLSVPAASAGP